MPFTIIENWFEFLDERTDGTLEVFARGETSDSHPRVDEAAKFATSSIYNALLTKYPTADVDAFTADDADAEMRLHAGALAMFALTSTGGGRSNAVDTDYVEAQTWLSKVRDGKIQIPNLTAVVDAGGVTPKGFVRFRARERNFTRGHGATLTDYDLRNPKV